MHNKLRETMSMLISRDQILQRALNFRSNHSVDVVALANDLGIKVLGTKVSQKSAWIKYDEDSGKYTIFVNISEPYTRQRFSIAHELSHFILHNEDLNDKGVLHRSPERLPDVQEAQADTLAAEILMPADLVADYLQQQGVDVANITSQDVVTLAQHFQVSNFVAVMRLRELGHYVPYLDFA